MSKYSQVITYWTILERDVNHQPVRYADPVELDARVEFKDDLFQNPDQEYINSSAKIFTDSLLVEEAYVLPRQLQDSDSANPRAIKGAFRIVRTRQIPSVDGEVFENVAWLG